jgi:uncharacterized RDD family membrane protein YckC
MTARVEPVPNEARVFQGRRAGLVTRVVAACVDVGVVAIALVLAYLGVVVVVFLVQRHEFEMPVPPLWLGPVAGAVAMTLYLAIWWHMGGRTYGNHVMGLRVLDRRGRKPGIVTAFLRAVLYVAFPLGLAWVVVSRQNRSIPDVVLRTSVIYDWDVRPGYPAAPSAAGDETIGPTPSMAREQQGTLDTSPSTDLREG